MFLTSAFLLSGAFFLESPVVMAAGPTVITDDIVESTTWTKEGSPYVLVGSISIEASLVIEPGVNVLFRNDPDTGWPAELALWNGEIDAIGTEDEPIVFTKESDSDIFSIIFDDGNIYDGNAGWSDFRYVHIIGGGEKPYDGGGAMSFLRRLFVKTAHAFDFEGTPAFSFWAGKLNIRHSIFSGSQAADVWTDDSGIQEWGSEEGEDYFKDSSSLAISDSNFDGDLSVPAFVSGDFSCSSPYPWECTERVTLRNNWYGAESGPKSTDNPDGEGKEIFGTVRLEGWSTEKFFDICADCPSNVFFLPGIKASKLYRETSSGNEDQLWTPNFFGNDLDDLALDGDGKSVESVYTRDVLDEVGIPVIGGNIYKSFLGELSDLKTAGTINDYQVFAYDWRQDAEDIAKNGTPYAPAALRSAITDLESLAGSSKTGKATIIAHSNGGLVAKAIMLELRASGKESLVDKIVFVGTPQMGTPMAVLSMLYGYEESALLGTLISREDARELMETMPGAYGLLPSATYFDRMEDPFVTFTSTRTRYEDFKDKYGDGIGDIDEFETFLTGEGDGRSEPSKSDVESENTLRRNLLDQANEIHARLDAWTPPSGVEVIQIAGWGLDTVGGIEYTEKEKAACYSGGGQGSVPSCTGIGEYDPIYEPKFTVDGDKVVVTPSALMLSEAENVKRYWVDLHENNKGLSIDRRHKDLLEVGDVKDFLSDIVTKTESSLPEFIKTTRPDNYEGASRLRMSLYSPLDIHLYDDQGRHTGPKEIEVDGRTVTIIEESIPNSYYYRFGERKYVGFGSGEHIRVGMDGYATGSYTLKLQEVQPTVTGESVVAHTTFAHLPVTGDTEVSLDIPAAGIKELPALEADLNGDAIGGEYAVEPVLDGTATLPTPDDDADMGNSGSEDGDDDEDKDKKHSRKKKNEERKPSGAAIRTASVNTGSQNDARESFGDISRHSTGTAKDERKRDEARGRVLGEDSTDGSKWDRQSIVAIATTFTSLLLIGIYAFRRYRLRKVV